MDKGAPDVSNGISAKETGSGEVGAKVNDVEDSVRMDFHQIHSEDAIKNDVFGERDFKGLEFGSKVLACATCCA